MNSFTDNIIIDPKKESPSIVTEYIQITKDFQSKYGKNTILLMQVGAFFEVYGLKNDKNEIIKETQIEDFGQICQLNVSEKKITMGAYQIVMAGFREYMLDKYLSKLTENGYSVVVYVQEKEGKNITRVFHSIHSAGTYISYETDSSPQITNNIMCIWLETFQPILQQNNEVIGAVKSRNTMVYGVAVANIFTGKSSIFEYQTPFLMNPTTFDELERYVSVYSPSEVIFLSSQDVGTVNTILRYSGIKSAIIHNIDLRDPAASEKAENCTKQTYIQHMLSLFYGEEAYQICSEFNTNPIATQAFCYLLNFVQEHNPNLVRNISIPSFNNTSHRMGLANHTLKQLNIIDEDPMNGKQFGKLSSVSSFLNKCCSPMGKRLFQSQIVNPTFDEQWLVAEYDMISRMSLPEHLTMIDLFRSKLREMRDLEKLARQLVLHKIYPASIYHLYTSIQNLQQMNVCLYEAADIRTYLCSGFSNNHNNNNELLADYVEHKTTGLLAFLNKYLKIDLCKGMMTVQTFEQNIFQHGISKKLDDLMETYENHLTTFDSIHTWLNRLMQTNESDTTEYVKLHETEKSGASLQITKKRGLVLKNAIQKILKDKPNHVENLSDNICIQLSEIHTTTASSNMDEITFPSLTRLSKEILRMKDWMNEVIAETYNDFLQALETEWFVSLENLAQYVAKLDVLQTKAHISRQYNYCRPEIVHDAEKSFVDATDLRHCLIEHLQQNELYVANNVCVGQSSSAVGDCDGILLYGTNAVGKTSLIRSLGIAVIMAQSGMFVPCSRFRFKPYSAIYSRILGNDNIFKGLSTFAVEMSELRIILKMADENSLILGDELCSGTESESALSIFVAGLMNLHEKRSSFLFATHFHEIIHYDEIKQLSRLCLKHMAVYFDRELDCLVYDRRLKDGPGNRMYGLEVCKSLYLAEDFLQTAYDIRNKYFPEGRGELSHSTTVYNAKKIRGICEMCKENIGEETHHLQPQKDANETGHIGTVHKNHPANLVAICQKCHDNLHKPNMGNSVGTGPVKKVVKRKTTKGFIVKSETDGDKNLC
jgi:DNA mismatch repair protein MutS